MPYRGKYTRRWFRRRLNTRRSRRFQRRLASKKSFPRTSGPRYGPFSKSYQTNLVYAGTFSLNPTLGATGVHTFKCNDLYDPDNTGLGHQPYGFDELMAIYQHWTVLGAKITLTTASNQTIPYWIHVRVSSDTSGGGTTTEDLLEQPGTASALVNVLDGGNNLKSVSKTFSAKNFFGKTKASIVGAADYRGNASSSPNELAYFRCFYSPNISGDDLGLQVFHVRISFSAVFTEPKMFQGS